MARQKERHPGWSVRQLRNPRHWQNGVRARLREGCRTLLEAYPGTGHTLLPEAMGVQVIRTARRLGIPVQVRPNGTIFKIALVGYLKDRLALKEQSCLSDYC